MENIAILSTIYSKFPPSDRLISELSRFVYLLYGDAASVDVNICRYNLFKLGKCLDDLLPPTYDTLVKHTERVNYQSSIWSRCLLPNPIIPSPIGNGWKLSNGELEVVWMMHPPAPDSLLDCINCKCKTQDVKHSVTRARKLIKTEWNYVLVVIAAMHLKLGVRKKNQMSTLRGNEQLR